MKTFLVAAAFLVLAVPAALAAPPAGHGNAGKNGNKPDTNTTTTSTTTSTEKNAAKACKAERASLGADAFAAKYGTNANKKNAYGKCVSETARKLTAEQQAEKNAAKACKAERASIGADAFAAKYGTNANKKNAFGKCVSKLAKAKSKPGSGTD